MRARCAALSFLFGISAFGAARSARATDCNVPLSTCINDDVLWPHAGPSHFIAVGSTELTAPGQLGFGLVTSYLSRPIAFLVPTPGPGGTEQYAVNDQVNGTFLWSYGVTRQLELDFALPVTFGQGGAGLEPITGGAFLHDTAMRDLRFGAAYAILPVHRPTLAPDVPGAPGPSPFSLAARLEVSAPTGELSQFAGEHDVVFVPSVAGQVRTGPLFVGAEAGARLRPTTDLAGARVGSQIVAMLGVGYDILPRELLAATLEAWMLPTLVGQAPGAADPLIPSEWQLAARTSPLKSGELAIQLGGGSAIPWGGESEITRPRFRFTLSIRWAPLGRPPPPERPETP